MKYKNEGYFYKITKFYGLYFWKHCFIWCPQNYIMYYGKS